MKSREQLVARALQELGVVGAGQAPAAEDAKTVNDEIGPLMSDLALRRVYAYGDPDQIADEHFVHLAVLLANSVAVSFGLAQDETKRLMAEGRLRDLRSVRDAGDPIRAEYF